MTPTEQRAWDAKIHALKHAGVPMPERVERARRELAAEAVARAKPEPPDPAPLMHRPTSCTDPAAPVAGDDPGAPAGTAHGAAGHDEPEVPEAQLGDAVASSAASNKPKAVKPATGSSKRRAGSRRRKTQSQTVEGNADTMNVSALPERITQIPPVGIDDRPLLDEKQAGQRIGVCQRTMYSLRASGELPHVRIRRRVFYRGEDIDQFLAAQARTDIPTEFRLSKQQLAGRLRKKSDGKGIRGGKKRS